MAANDSATPPGGLYTPPATSPEAAPLTSDAPRRSAFRPVHSSPAPTAAPSAPATTTPFQWAPQPSAPVTTPLPTEPRTVAPAGDSGGAFSGSVDKVKGFALRAKNSLTEGDDLSASAKRGGPRKARVLVSRIDPWSVLKMGFLLSIAIGVMTVVATFVLWNALNEFGLFALIDEWVAKLFDGEQPIDITSIFELNKVMSAAVLVSVMNVVLLTALSTIAAFLYNTVSSVVGGVYVTLTDD